MTGMGRQSVSGWTIEGEDGEASRAGGHDSSFAKPLVAPTPLAPSGPATSSTSTDSKVVYRIKWKNRTIKRETLMERILEQ